MTPFVILDAGPLIALLDKNDPFHGWAESELRKYFPVLLTCEAALSEASFMLEKVYGGRESLLTFLRESPINVLPTYDGSMGTILDLLDRYPMFPCPLPMPVSPAFRNFIRMPQSWRSTAIFSYIGEIRMRPCPLSFRPRDCCVDAMELKTKSDRLKLPADCYAYQLIRSEIVDWPTMTIYENEVHTEIGLALYQFVNNKKLGEVCFVPIDLYLTEHDIFQPDIIFVSTEYLDSIKEDGVYEPPDLVIEVVSEPTAHFDYGPKRET
jgi:hypothetical protein